MTRLVEFLERHQRIAIAITRTSILVVTLAVLGFAADRGYHAWLESRPTANWFEYEAVTYSHSDPDGALWFTSVASWHRPVEGVVWVDQLQCRTAGAANWSRYSEQAIGAEGRDALGSTVVDWPYTQPAPDNGRCRLQSTITVDIGRGITKQQILYSAPFDI